ncbi:hypothetical protein DPMN_123093 [Dreissena polymorpha]|uniref:Uncharacterized protein n=1 Tax=Dreissena polymorpha TaxID=45954 RepID=A0A9D4JQY7_DREPO|nr:hypothetical protein DPMN_123093 [Dreissena polymorpha]
MSISRALSPSASESLSSEELLDVVLQLQLSESESLEGPDVESSLSESELDESLDSLSLEMAFSSEDRDSRLNDRLLLDCVKSVRSFLGGCIVAFAGGVCS